VRRIMVMRRRPVKPS